MPHWIPSTPETWIMQITTSRWATTPTTGWPPPTPVGGLYPSPSVDPAPNLYPGGTTSERWAPDTDTAWA